jgi:pimeloyl-ACP methyl ester carboxylesterase
VLDEDERMPHFSSYDATVLAYHEKGTGQPLLCVPGGPFRASAYLGDLGGLSAHRRLILLDHRGTGDSQTPADPDTYACVNVIKDVEALRAHLGLDRVDLLSHSASGNVLTLYAASYPERVSRMVLVAPGWRATDLEFTDDEWIATMHRRAAEPWFEAAFAAMMRLDHGEWTEENRIAAAPFFFGRWTKDARELTESERSQVNRDAQLRFRGPDSFGDPADTRKRLTSLTAPVLLLGGDLDPAPTPRLLREYVNWFPNGRLVIQPEAGHSPWIDDADVFVATVAGFLAAG